MAQKSVSLLNQEIKEGKAVSPTTINNNLPSVQQQPQKLPAPRYVPLAGPFRPANGDKNSTVLIPSKVPIIKPHASSETLKQKEKEMQQLAALNKRNNIIARKAKDKREKEQKEEKEKQVKALEELGAKRAASIKAKKLQEEEKAKSDQIQKQAEEQLQIAEGKDLEELLEEDPFQEVVDIEGFPTQSKEAIEAANNLLVNAGLSQVEAEELTKSKQQKQQEEAANNIHNSNIANLKKRPAESIPTTSSPAKKKKAITAAPTKRKPKTKAKDIQKASKSVAIPQKSPKEIESETPLIEEEHLNPSPDCEATQAVHSTIEITSTDKPGERKENPLLHLTQILAQTVVPRFCLESKSPSNIPWIHKVLEDDVFLHKVKKMNENFVGWVKFFITFGFGLLSAQFYAAQLQSDKYTNVDLMWEKDRQKFQNIMGVDAFDQFSQRMAYCGAFAKFTNNK